MTTKITGDNISSIANTGVNWNAVTVADGSTQLNASAGNGYFLDTNTGVIEVFFPTSPSRGDTIVLADYSGTFATNQAIVNTGTQNLDSTTTRQYKLTTNDTITEFVYVDSAKGWITKINQAAGTTPSGAFNSDGGYDTQLPSYITATGGTITTSGDFKIHSFTGDGTFSISAGFGPLAKVDYVVVAGGGGGGGGIGGGGGAGGFRESHAEAVSGPYTASPLATPTSLTCFSPGSYPVTVGAGGAGTGSAGVSFQPDIPGVPASTAGSNSIFSTITSAGGGYGRHYGSQPSPTLGGPGGSGGGGSGNVGGNGGPGNDPAVSPPQGNDGGNGNPSNPWSSGGGGGATAVGGNHGPTSGPGGAGATTNITGSPVTYSGGGGGGGSGYGNPGGGTGGSGGGGTGGPGSNSTAATAGTANTGGGGGGGQQCTVQRGGANGGKGIVILRYKFQE